MKKDRPEYRKKFDNKNKREDRRRDTEDSGSGFYLKGAAKALIDLDQELMKLLVRRSVLVSRVRNGNEHAATPQAIYEEKMVRRAWEENAPLFSKDPKFIRNLFTLLQDLKVLSKEQAQNKPGYKLSPFRKAVEISMTGGAYVDAVLVNLFLSGFLNSELNLNNIIFSDNVLDSLKTLSQLGLNVEYSCNNNGLGSLKLSKSTEKVVLAGKTVYCGSSLLAFYLTAFSLLSETGVVRFTGGEELKDANLSELKRIVPMLGARLSNSIPRSTGLPVSIESSGVLPNEFTIPTGLCYEGVVALLIAPVIWGKPFTIDIGSLPATVASSALALADDLFQSIKAEVSVYGSKVVYGKRGELDFIKEPELPLDPVKMAYILAIPAFAGGRCVIKGKWDSFLPASQQVLDLLRWAGLSVKFESNSIASERTGKHGFFPADCQIVPNLIPLYYSLLALEQHNSEQKENKASIAFCSIDSAGEDFLRRLGAELPTAENDEISKLVPTSDAPWVSPDGYWGMAWALGAFLRGGIKIANPDSVTDIVPCFWNIYNNLPNPADPINATDKNKGDSSEAPSRKRVIVNR